MHVKPINRWRTVFGVTRAVAAVVAVLLLALGPGSERDVLLGAAGVAWAAATCLAVLQLPAAGGRPWFWILDVAVALMLVAEAGEWRSPFYLFFLTALVLPSTGLSLRWALPFAALAVAGYVGVAIATGVDWRALTTTPRLESFATHLAVPILVAVLLGHAARLVERLAAEQQRSARLAVQTERRRIAWDLHDSAKQRLNAAHLLLSAITPNGHGEPLAQAQRELRSALVDMDSSIRDEALPTAADGDVLAAVRRRVAELQQVSPAAIEVSGSSPRLPPPAAAHVFRVAQEAVLNAVRHGKARRIDVRFAQVADRLSVVVRDDGCGLPVEQRPGAAGIRSMRNRAASLGGELHVVPGKAGRGTVVVLEVPLA